MKGMVLRIPGEVSSTDKWLRDSSISADDYR